MTILQVNEGVLKALRELGLTEYEVQAYVTLVSGGQMSASEASTASRVPYSRIYDVLGRLEARGFLQIQRGRPTRYIPKSPSEVMRLVQLEWEERLAVSSRVVVEQLQPLFERKTQATTRDVWLLYGRSAILAKALGMLDAARETVMLSIPVLGAGAFSASSQDLSALIEKLLSLKAPTVRILTAAIDDDLKSLIPRGFEIRLRERVFGVGLVCDGVHTLIMLAGSQDETSLLGIYASAPVFAEMSSTYFSNLWNESEPFHHGI